MMTLEERVQRLEDYEALRALQSRYQRAIDFHDWDALKEIFAEDAVCQYNSGKISYEGADKIIAFLSKSLTKAIKSSHMIHGGEIDIQGVTATGTWYLEDFLLHKFFFVKLHGSAVYKVEYRKDGGQWKIARIGYQRGYHYFELRGLVNIFTLR